MAVAASSRRTSLPLGGGSDGAGVAVTPLRTAEMLAMPHFLQRPRGPLPALRGAGVLTPKSRWTPVPIPCFLVEHPTAGPFLVDTGMTPAAVGEGARALGRLAGFALDVRMQEGWASGDQLAARGIDPLNVGLVVMTHLHFDHAGAVAQYPHATFVVDQAEWEAAATGNLLQGYSPALIDHPFDWRTLDFGSRDVSSFASFARTLDLFGDGSVRLLSTPGHTKGHLSVLLRLASGGELLLTGDAAYARRTIDERLVPTLCDDVHRYRRSLGEIRRYVDLTPGASVVCGHDAESWPALPERFD
ncbi:MAG: N-acyl homoserine lactone hydrolase [Solirubrobacteraceae bacterium]|jgi:glyoxylase-like metal-dependent hydrolase (beta-lactamase superfamily II)|nr:N-acyl homoserine lactone hydrolase [Solirubrobacteraceae bacterium]